MARRGEACSNDEAYGVVGLERKREKEGERERERELQVMGSTFRYVTFPFSSSASIL